MNINTPLSLPSQPTVSPNDANQPAAGKGLPDKQQQPQKPLAGRHETQKDRSVERSLEMPNERDEATDMTAAPPDPKITQAAKDVADGLRDTSKASETDQTYEKFRK
jgi:hypothetical protein